MLIRYQEESGTASSQTFKQSSLMSLDLCGLELQSQQYTGARKSVLMLISAGA